MYIVSIGKNCNGLENQSGEKKFGIGAQLPSHFKSLGIELFSDSSGFARV